MSIIDRWYRNLDSHATEEINIQESQSILWRGGGTVRERLCRREDSNQGGHPAEETHHLQREVLILTRDLRPGGSELATGFSTCLALKMLYSPGGVNRHIGNQCILNTSCMLAQSLSQVQLFCHPLDSNPPGSSVHRISQARILEWVAISFSRGSSRPRDRTQVS